MILLVELADFEAGYSECVHLNQRVERQLADQLEHLIQVRERKCLDEHLRFVFQPVLLQAQFHHQTKLNLAQLLQFESVGVKLLLSLPLLQ